MQACRQLTNFIRLSPCILHKQIQKFSNMPPPRCYPVYSVVLLYSAHNNCFFKQTVQNTVHLYIVYFTVQRLNPQLIFKKFLCLFKQRKVGASKGQFFELNLSLCSASGNKMKNSLPATLNR